MNSLQKTTLVSLAAVGLFCLGIAALAVNQDIIMNEIGAYEPSDHEWIEIYNKGTEAVNIEGWKFYEDETNHGLTAFQGDFVIEPGEYAIIADNAENFVLDYPNFSGTIIDSSWSSLRESGEEIALKDAEGNIVESFTYIEAPNFSLERKDPALADYTSANWQEHTNGNTAGAENSRTTTTETTNAETAEEETTEQPATEDATTESNPAENTESASNGAPSSGAAPPSYSEQIKINEVLPNPEGDDLEGEFIELKNFSSEVIDLENWIIADQSRQYLIKGEDFDSTHIPANGFFVLPRTATKIALNNSGGETVTLYNPNEEETNSVTYQESAASGESYILKNNNNWDWSKTPTPGAENIERINEPPQAAIDGPDEIRRGIGVNFDGSDSFDPDGDPLTYRWVFPDQSEVKNSSASYTFKQEGEFIIKLTVTDSEGLADTVEKTIIVSAPSLPTPAPSASANPVTSLKINEFLPNPEGTDSENEWIEIKNIGGSTVNLTGVKVDDEEGGSNPYSFPEGSLLAAGQFILLERPVTKITLNNSNDSVRLLDEDGQIIDQINYEGAKEGFSYALDGEGDWVWSSDLSPGQENTTEESEAKNGEEAKENSSTEQKEDSETNSSDETIPEIAIEDIRDIKLGKKIKVEGVVLIEPGVLGKQIFYINGLQVYSYKGDFPVLKRGDFIEIEGALSETHDERRIKIKQKENIKILGASLMPFAHDIAIGEIDDELLGMLVSVRGEVARKQSPSIYITDGDETRIYLKESTGLHSALIKKEDKLEVYGILSKTKSGFRILPRDGSDIRIVNPLPLPVADGKGGEIEKTDKPQNTPSAPQSLALTVKRSYGNLFPYYLSSVGALLVLSGGLLLRERRSIALWLRK